ncbi:MAG: GntR family transcriptional regulator [Microbacteriaceae bacterium]|nr:GntR family transcriptional regulator [Cryobacterium sp.]MBX3104014.1 GntR family transcriptional regulator [Cryobacterium sp.]MCC6376458.1 GntR family transcriptional regulator [Microbacteriaceae bacterium]
MRASDKAYLRLRDEILHWRTPPGTVLAEVEQAQRLGISRTPIREAFSRLTAEGLLVPLAGRGLVVTELSRETIIDMFELRIALECEAARIAATNVERLSMTDEFENIHAELLNYENLIELGDELKSYYELVARLDAALDAAATNQFLLSAINQLRPHLARVRQLARDNKTRLVEAAREHLTIVEAIIAGDAELAADATSVHLKKSLNNILRSVDAAGGISKPLQGKGAA